MLAAAFAATRRLLGPPTQWLRPGSGVGLDAVSRVFVRLTRGGVIGATVDQCGTSGGLGSVLAVQTLPQCLRCLVRWFAGGAGAPATALSEWLTAALAEMRDPQAEFGSFQALHRRVQQCALLMPCLGAAACARLLRTATQGFGAGMQHGVGLRLLVLLQESWLLCAHGDPALRQAVLDALRECVPAVRDFVSGCVRFCGLSADADPAAAELNTTEMVDVYAGTAYAMTLTAAGEASQVRASRALMSIRGHGAWHRGV